MFGLVQAPDRDGKLAYEEWGDPKGYPVFLLHGTPGSRLGPRPLTFDLHKLAIRLIAYDRPGYGDSDRHYGRRVADAAKDVAAIADALEIERYSVVGRSGGGPHALACAALSPGRVASAAAVVTVAPPDAEGLNWLVGMADSNVMTYSMMARHSPDLTQVSALLARNADAIRRNPSSLLNSLNEEMPDVDRRVVEDAGIRDLLLLNYLSAVGESTGSRTELEDPPEPTGWVDDLVSFREPWGFKPEDIEGVPILLWHGEHDVFSPVSHFRWLAERIPGASAVLQPSAAHFAALPALPPILAWVRDNAA
ncbi:alpha/beta fold hydrolase [Streptomyces sp. NBC_00829]|uniref:alpha/beta fold hydrolase n=1 Tax=Streptomyces sp. NBC_00829 TaxID=2903679 RepID=UPI00386A54DA|nr:alpha/beta hydrolase [Streptomyces sp. NBC_00829]